MEPQQDRIDDPQGERTEGPLNEEDEREMSLPSPLIQARP